MSYTDFFIQTKIRAANQHLQISDLGSDFPNIYLSSTPGHELSNGDLIYYTRIPTRDEKIYLEIIEKLDIKIIGKSWLDVWNNHRDREDIFTVIVPMIDNNGIKIGTSSIKISQMRALQLNPETRQVYPPGVFSGDEPIELYLSSNYDDVKTHVQAELFSIRQRILTDNVLDANEKNKIFGYIDAILAIEKQWNPDRGLRSKIGDHLKEFLSKILIRYGRHELIEFLVEFLKTLG